MDVGFLHFSKPFDMVSHDVEKLVIYGLDPFSVGLIKACLVDCI